MYVYRASNIEKQCDGASLAALLPPPPGYPIKISSAAARLPCSRALEATTSYYGFTAAQVFADKHTLPSLSSFFDSDDDKEFSSSSPSFRRKRGPSKKLSRQSNKDSQNQHLLYPFPPNVMPPNFVPGEEITARQ